MRQLGRLIHVGRFFKMKIIRNILSLLLIATVIFSCKNEAKPEIKTVDKKQNFSDYLRKQEVERKIKNLEKDKKKAFISRDKKITQLRSNGNRANNNLAGATWQQSLAQEMTAVMQQANTEVESIDKG